MNEILIKNIGQLLTIGGSSAPKVQKQMSELGLIKNAYVYIKNGKIFSFGTQEKLKKKWPLKHTGKLKIIDAGGQVAMPGLIDCHTHLVFGGNRAQEFSEKINGTPYLEILKKGGGILSTVKSTRASSSAELEKNALGHLREMLELGITTIEAKSGYGLDLETELKILKIIKRLNKQQPIEIVPTFLGAHTTPPEFKGKSDEYLHYLVGKVLPQAKKYAGFCDIFCEKGVFSPEQTRAYLHAAKQLGFKLKIHADQLHSYQGAEIAAELKAVSADHLDHISPTGLKKMAKSRTIAVLLPGVPFFLKTEKYAPAQKIIATGIPIALSTDFNPGSCTCKNLFLIMTIACLKMNLTIEQAINAVTINAAHALEKAHEVGSIEAGKTANLLMLNARDYREIPYWMGRNLTETVVVSKNKKSKIIKTANN